MQMDEIDRIAARMGGSLIPPNRIERALDRLMEVLVAVVGTRSWGSQG